jgi:TDG/mug DNA glycosylase family protein
MPTAAVRKTQVVRDNLRRGLDLVIVGINPGLASAAARSPYASPTNHFWPLLYESGIVGEPLTFRDYRRTLEFGVGLTNIVDRESRNIDALSKDELRAGAEALGAKLRRYRPRVVAFNGKSIAEVFLGHKVTLGLQPERWHGMAVFVMPSTSARTASYQRPAKLAFFKQLKRAVDKESARDRGVAP